MRDKIQEAAPVPTSHEAPITAWQDAAKTLPARRNGDPVAVLDSVLVDGMALVSADGNRPTISSLAASQDDARDAERYRFLRGDGGPQSLRWPDWSVQSRSGAHWNEVKGEHLDRLIDAAKGGAK